MSIKEAPRSSVYRTAERAVPGGNLRLWLIDQRQKGQSVNSMAGELRDLGVIVSPQAVHGWLIRWGIESKAAAS